MNCTREEIKEEFLKYYDYLVDNKKKVEVHNNGVIMNVYDDAGIKQSLYPSKATIVFHASNDKKDYRSVTLRKVNMDQFMYYLKHPEEIQALIKGSRR